MQNVAPLEVAVQPLAHDTHALAPVLFVYVPAAHVVDTPFAHAEPAEHVFNVRFMYSS